MAWWESVLMERAFLGFAHLGDATGCAECCVSSEAFKIGQWQAGRYATTMLQRLECGR